MDSADWQALTGQTEQHLCLLDNGSGQRIHAGITADWHALLAAAARQGMRIVACSAFRSFDRQLAIWNGKASGGRPVFDSEGRPVDMASLSPRQQLFAILRWSAIPGCSRHHWGTDLDIYDADAVPDDYRVQLTREESDTVFSHLHRWLDIHLQDYGFFRPYAVDSGGIAPESWHISHAATAALFEQQLDETRLASWLAQQDIALKPEILVHWHTIFHRYIRVDASRQPASQLS